MELGTCGTGATTCSQSDKMFTHELKDIPAPHSSQVHAGKGNVLNPFLSFPPLTRDLNRIPSETELSMSQTENQKENEFLALNEHETAAFDDMVMLADDVIISAPLTGEDGLVTADTIVEEEKKGLVDENLGARTVNMVPVVGSHQELDKTATVTADADQVTRVVNVELNINLPAALGISTPELLPTGENSVTEEDIMSIKGQKVRKKFGKKYYSGDVVDYDAESKWFKVVYEDGDEEDLELWEVKAILESSTSTRKKMRAEDAAADDQMDNKIIEKWESSTSRRATGSGLSKLLSSTMGKQMYNASSVSTESSVKEQKASEASVDRTARRMLRRPVTESGEASTIIAGDSHVGKHVKKDFDGKLYDGVVVKFDKKTQYYKIRYEDGDREDLELHELEPILVVENQSMKKSAQEKPDEQSSALSPASQVVA